MLEREMRLMTIDSAAKQVPGLTKWRIRELCVTGRLPTVKAGRKYLINAATLYDFVNNPAEFPEPVKSDSLRIER